MKLAIKLPNNLQDTVQSFPFLHGLNKLLVSKWDNNEIDDFEIHLICLKDHIGVLNLLPFKAFYHELEEQELKSVFSVHRAIKNNIKLDYIDVFFSLTNSFVDASIGKNLNSEVRIGWAIGKNKLFFNRAMPALSGQHQSDQMFSLLKGFEDKEDLLISNVRTRELEPITTDYLDNPYNVINLKHNESMELDSQWNDFFDLFEGQKFYIACDGLDESNHSETVEQWIKNFNPKNQYEVYDPKYHIQFAKLVAHAKNFITYDSGLLYLAAYCATNCFWLNEKKLAAEEYPEYFYADTKRYDLNTLTSLSPVFDEIYEKVNLKVAPDVAE